MSVIALGRPHRLLLLLLPLAGLFASVPADAGLKYAIDTRTGSIDFAVGHLGLFTSHGQFRHFDAALIIDQAHPDQTQIDVAVDAASVDMPWQEGADMLRSAAFFDVVHHPDLHFRSTSVAALAPDRYVVSGLLEIRGVTQPIILEARLTGRENDAGGAPVSADFVVSGRLSRAAFGMVSEQTFISDTVVITIHARVALAHAG